MDATLEERWRAGQPPFAGDCLIADGNLTVDELRELLPLVTSRLRKASEGLDIFAFDDWHSHDGFITQRRKAQWSEFDAFCRSRETLIDARQGDTYVHRAYYPSNAEFLLRFDMGDDDVGDGCGWCASVDVSASSAILQDIQSIVPSGLKEKLKRANAKAYFDLTYAG